MSEANTNKRRSWLHLIKFVPLTTSEDLQGIHNYLSSQDEKKVEKKMQENRRWNPISNTILQNIQHIVFDKR